MPVLMVSRIEFLKNYSDKSKEKNLKDVTA